MSRSGRVRRLAIGRLLSTGEPVEVGALARDRTGTWFEYAPPWLASGGPSLSPFSLELRPGPQRAEEDLPSRTDPVHGVFADALPDGWGLRVMDRAFRRAGIEPSTAGALDRLAFLGDRTVGAFAFDGTAADLPREPDGDGTVDLAALGTEAARLFDGDDVERVHDALVRSGGSGGARPKALLWEGPDGTFSASPPGPDARDAPDREAGRDPAAAPRLVKFTSANLPLGHEEGRMEAAWLAMAATAGIDAQRGRLVERETPGGTRAWLVLERFDRTGARGRLHLHSASGLLGADHRLPSLDLADLVRASERLCESPAAARETLRRGLFNLLSSNQDDHARNWAWLMDDAGGWRPSPAYDLTFSPSPSGEHMTAFGGHGAAPPAKAVRELAALASVDRSTLAEMIDRIDGALARWPREASAVGLSAGPTRDVGRRLAAVRRENASLVAR